MKTRERVLKIIQILNRKYKIKTSQSNPFQTLITCILSQRTKDEITRSAAKRLLIIANKPEKILKLHTQKIAKLIYPVGFYNQKAKRIKKICQILMRKYGGQVPRTRQELLQLPGVGEKTASIVLSYGYGKPTIAVDTHVNRISKRLGIVPKNSRPEKTQEILEKLIPKRYQILVNHLFVTFGKEICKPRKPKCGICPINNCPYPSQI